MLEAGTVLRILQLHLGSVVMRNQLWEKKRWHICYVLIILGLNSPNKNLAEIIELKQLFAITFTCNKFNISNSNEFENTERVKSLHHVFL